FFYLHDQLHYCYPEATFEANNSNSTSLQLLVYVPRVGPALRPKLTNRPLRKGTLGKVNQDIASLQYLARVRNRPSREVP
ncbi:hypothetical protein BDW62DRAFT_195881, partial [Aspergillus aurantiobrunneus]